MKDQSTTEQELLKEISSLKKRIYDLEHAEIDRKLAQEALQESETKLQAIFDTVGTGILIIDRDTQVIIEANQTAIEMTGLSKERIVGQICHSLVCPAQAGKCPVKDLGQIVDHSERMLIHADGHLKDILKTVYPITIKGKDYYIESFIDISDSKQAEEALRESEDRFRQLFDNMADGVAIYRAIDDGDDFIFVDINRKGQLSSAISRSDAIGKRITEAFPAVEKIGLLDVFRKVWLTGEAQHHPLTMYKDGRVKQWVENYVFKLPSGLIVTIYSDTTEKLMAEEALRESEEKYRLVVENAAEVILIAQDGLLKYVNPMAVKILGYSEEVLTTRPFVELLHPDDIQKVVEAHMRIMKGEKNQPVHQFRVLSLDGTVRWVDSRAVVISWEGKPATVNFITDITERKKVEEALQKSEDRYRSFVENASDIVFRTDGSGHFIFINPAGLRITGYKEEELIGTHYPVLISPEMCEETLKFFGRQFVKIIPNTYFEYPIIAKDGHEIWLGQNTQLIIEDDRVVGFQAVARDITDRKRMEKEILVLSITDQLTGLHNRRGFLSLAGQQLKLSERNKSGMCLFFADLDLLKWINDELGHEQGDKALIEAANMLKETFRTSDIIARLGGDEYAVLVVDITEGNSKIFTSRLQAMIDKRNNQENRKYKLSISMGCAYYDPENPCSIDDLIARADKLMYEQKQNKKGLLLQSADI
ncbi:MAG: PAS domain S-box protein [Proteobacteria bacterium]|nr:PAS domain S-box protein [Pseudomonadota bacterium]